METNEPESKSSAGSGMAVKVGIVVLLALAVGAVMYVKTGQHAADTPGTATTAAADPKPADRALKNADPPKPVAAATKPALPRLVDLGATKCVPCKMMAPILEDLKKEYAGRLDVEFIDVWERPEAGGKYRINLIPTQVFLDASGKELFRHEGFFSKLDILARWKQLGVDLSGQAPPAGSSPDFSRLEPASPDTRPKETVCYMCDGDNNPRTRTVLKTDKGEVAFCSPHCYLIAYSSMVENKPVLDSVSVTDWSTGAAFPAGAAKYVYGVDAKNRPTIKAFADTARAAAEQKAAGGNILEWLALQDKELATRCGFCDRAVYPEDACAVNVEGGPRTWGCCTMCALGVAARLQKDIGVSAKDALTGEAIAVKTSGGHVSSLDPKTAVAWAGTKKDDAGKLVSTGCFKQAFFANEADLRKWADARPNATGRMIPIEQALAEKMALTPQQISKACKIGECTPK